MMPKNVTVLLLLVITIANACDFDLLVETLYDDYSSDEDETSTTNPNSSSSQTTTQSSQNSTPGSSGSSSSSSPMSTTQTTPNASQASPQTNSVTAASNSRGAKAHRHRKKRKHVIGKILQETKSVEETRNSKLYENIDPYSHRYAPDFTKPAEKISNHDMDEKTIESGRNLQSVYDDNREDDDNGDEDLPRALTFDALLRLSQLNEDDDSTLIESARSKISNHDMLLKLLLAAIEENAKMQKRKRKRFLKQKQERIEANKKKFEAFLKLLEKSWKHIHNEKKEGSGISQQVVIVMPGEKKLQDSKKDDTFDDKTICKADKDNYVTCIKDQTTYETIKLNPKDHSGTRQVEDRIRYSTIKDNAKIKDSMDHVFKGKDSYLEHEGSHGYEPYPYQESKRRHNHHPYDNDHVRDEDHSHRRHHVDVSNRFNPEDKDKLEEESATKKEEISSSSKMESTTSLPVSDKP